MLSVIIPVYRTEATLGRCVESVLAQGVGDMEVILVDDGSPDGCPALCDEWAERDSRIRVVHKLNGGLSSARNAGIDVAKGAWITFVDSDDYLAPDTYAEVTALMADADIVEFPVFRFYGSPRQKRLRLKERTYTGMEGQKDYWLNAYAYEHCYAWNKVYRRQLFDDVRFPQGQVFEDVATLPRLLWKCRCVKTTKHGLYYYCANDSGITATATGQELQQLLEAHMGVLWHSDRYYMHIVNIQLDVARLTGQKPILPRKHVDILFTGLSFSQKLKAIVINTLGLNVLCRINKWIHRS